MICICTLGAKTVASLKSKKIFTVKFEETEELVRREGRQSEDGHVYRRVYNRERQHGLCAYLLL